MLLIYKYIKMETQEKNEKKGKLNTTVTQLGFVIVLILVLMIPLEFVKHLIKERKDRKHEVVQEISEKWGEKVQIYGPIIKIPYSIYSKKTKRSTDGEKVEETSEEIKFAYFLPEELEIKTNVKARNLHRGMYEAVVFKSDLDFKGNFIKPNFSSQKINIDDVHWNEAKFILQTTNLKSIRNELKIKLNGKNLSFEPVFNNKTYEMQALETDYVDLKKILNTKKKVDFNMNLSYNGSESLMIIPIGKVTTAQINSNWEDPSFTGSFLPIDKSINEQGFNASWKVLHINRPFSQEFFGGLPQLNEYAFGVNFIVQVDQYQQNERASKYGILVIGLTFLTFFMIQVINKLKIHIVEYGMIGVAMVLFYTLLLSITEHSSFSIAYLISAAAVIALILFYSFSILKYRKLLVFVSGAMVLLYSYIYVIIQMENYALLSGSIGLFIILTIVMYFSRKIDWQK